LQWTSIRWIPGGDNILSSPLRKDASELKAIVLCAGKGTRLRPLTDSIAKPLVPIANRPVLFYVLDQIVQVGIKEIGIIVSPENKHQISNAVSRAGQWPCDIHYIVQKEAGGLAHAVTVAENFLGSCRFMMFLGDNVIQGNLSRYAEQFCNDTSLALILLKEVDDPRLFGVAELGSHGKVIRLVEKPREPKSNLAMVGIYFFSPDIHSAIKQIKPSGRGELEITDAIQWLLDQGKEVNSQTVCGWWLDTGKKDDLLAANRIVLEEFAGRDIRGQVDAASTITGRVEIGSETQIINSIVTGPVSIAGNCIIKNATVKPYTSINDGCYVDNASLENTIVLGNVSIRHILYLKDSIIGNHTEILGKADNTRQIKVFLGSYSKLEID